MAAVIAVFVFLLADIGYKIHHREPPAPVPAQSWDQENLKRNDAGCPTAIYVAPNGNLEQCQ